MRLSTEPELRSNPRRKRPSAISRSTPTLPRESDGTTKLQWSGSTRQSLRCPVAIASGRSTLSVQKPGNGIRPDALVALREWSDRSRREQIESRPARRRQEVVTVREKQCVFIRQRGGGRRRLDCPKTFLLPDQDAGEPHSEPAGGPFSATDRFMNNTANVTTNVNAAAIQKASKKASEDACC